jgi:type II secretory pathway predicted ATPase ExeA
MATPMSQGAIHKLRLESNPNDGRGPARARLIDYLQRTGLTQAEFATRIQYAFKTLRMFLSDKWYHVAGNSDYICSAINSYIDAHPIAPMTQPFGTLYETANTRAMRETFKALLRRPVAYMIYAPPGSQKSYSLEYLIRELNREESAKREPAQAAFYFYAIAQMTPAQVMKGAAIACGTSSAGDRMRIARNLAHDFQGRRVLLVVDEAQHLSINGFETLRVLLDQPPHFSLLFSGSHDLKQTFDRFSATLEQWNSRMVDKVRLPGVKEDEAEGIIRREIGELLKAGTAESARRTIRALIAGATVKDGFEKDRKYLNIRTLTSALEQIKLQAEGCER